jgi:hypothetical protein
VAGEDVLAAGCWPLEVGVTPWQAASAKASSNTKIKERFNMFSPFQKGYLVILPVK